MSKRIYIFEVEMDEVPKEKSQSIPLVGDRVVLARDGFLQLFGEVLEVHDRSWYPEGPDLKVPAHQTVPVLLADADVAGEEV